MKNLYFKCFGSLKLQLAFITVAAKNKNKETILHKAAKNKNKENKETILQILGNLDLVKYLIELIQFDLKSKNNDNETLGH